MNTFLRNAHRLPMVIVAMMVLGCGSAADGGVGMAAPEFANDTWINSEPQRLSGLRGKVVLVEFWTFGCYNCRNVEPYVKEWHKKYSGKGLVIIGVHSPEFSHERAIENVKRYVSEHGIRYAVAVDNDFATWNRYQNRYWPAMYLIDKKGVIRYIRIGEGGYRQTEEQILGLLTERES
jgi:thiol-disulfide isomerase/thioredoxin